MTTLRQTETPEIGKIYRKKGTQAREVVQIGDGRVRYHTVTFDNETPASRSFESTDISLKGWVRWWRAADRTHKSVVGSPVWAGGN